jgi:hypothetical protein
VWRLGRCAVLFAVLAALAGCLTATAGAAQAAVPTAAVPTAAARAAMIAEAAESPSPPGWRIKQVLAGAAIGGLWAGGARDGWLAGDECADPATCGTGDTSNGTVVVRHWDGKAWRVLTAPGAYINSPLDQGVAAVTATSASNAWVLAARGSESVDHTDALHWTGRRWAAPVRLNAAIQAAVAPSATQLWAFGQSDVDGQPGYFAHFNGRAWTHGSFPLSGTAAAGRSASDVWVGGDTAKGLGIEHWDGHRWHVSALPNLGLGSGSALQLFADIFGIVDLGLDNVWADIGVLNATGANPPGTIILHWNGKAWSRVKFPYVGDALTPVAYDGHGGIWLATAAGSGNKVTLWFDHYSGGHWTRVKVPSREGDQPEMDNLSWIPGTHSLWATGGVDFDNDGEAVLKYGV